MIFWIILSVVIIYIIYRMMKWNYGNYLEIVKEKENYEKLVKDLENLKNKWEVINRRIDNATA